ncbi:50S ribosomal protein L1 [candidate division WOR-1 bacterium RIFOXYA12_FULL_43_27]|uniref:Large ribosomal subunit protein uL1 n=1 Tax=candidate division WOR-1 bacterium RIFOXYC2_FULL_46_14 TaxID=1802587 RepID=A0A1F4U658_UNCSA|nr:MAG: 50S ribosomal protein L1 [candidate division WOR-1 bacterium RIFOXYA12_FULL_43_27]OGC20455.1 MAG: 50S ribosomal protein L1 [candidate division WOR-1 bacterium RIFOXYB2_FULL_46_45]OGC31808.1 MAG: 50S ribosomal protein L1 [candidate division WOR-1 bacterium RIFOXYA2_FULL_46_56]OGC40300.1 MAG: 50S ribosomal protein L1 [candidate division WOR-1 bacterium RIFOXYC2_FULL_46_14]
MKIEKKKVDRNKVYKPEAAIKLLKEVAWAKFDEGVDLSIKLGTTPKKGTAPVRGVVSLPHGTGKKVKIAVIGSGVKVGEAETAGADVFGGEDLIEKIEKGFIDFDILIATPDMMGKVGKLGKVLGKRGLMPNPKSQTVTLDIKETVQAFKKGKAEFKMDDTGVVHILIGKKSFADQAIIENLKTAVAAVQAAKPSSVKGAFIKSIFISSSMGSGIRLENASLVEI